MNKKWLILIFILGILYFEGFIPEIHIDFATKSGVAGFWAGLWQGLLIPIAFIWSLFNSDVHIYQSVNNGIWYDFGFIIGIILCIGNSRSVVSR